MPFGEFDSNHLFQEKVIVQIFACPLYISIQGYKFVLMNHHNISYILTINWLWGY